MEEQRAAAAPKSGLLGAEVGKRIRAARLERGMTLAQVGGDDLSRSFLSLVELGRSRISLRALSIVADRLDLPMSYFLDDSAGGAHAAAELLVDQADVALAQRNPQEALRLLDATPPPRQLQIRALWIKGGALNALGRYRDAIPVLREGVDLAINRDDGPMRLQLRYRLGLALYSSDAYDEALVQLRQLLSEAGENPEEPMLIARSIVCIGHILYVRNDVDAALQHYERARDLFGSVSDLNDLACVYSGLSVSYERKGDLQNALRYSRLSLGVFEAQNSGRHAAIELNNMAARYRELGQLEQALECATASVERASKVNAHDIEAIAHCTLAAIYLDLENYVESLRQAEIAERLSEDDARLPRIEAWIVMAKIAEHDGDTKRADELFRRALDMLKDVQHHSAYADAALAYSLALRKRGNTEGALEYALQAAQMRPTQPV